MAEHKLGMLKEDAKQMRAKDLHELLRSTGHDSGIPASRMHSRHSWQSCARAVLV